MKLSIVIPAYNESGRIGRTLQYYATFFDALKKEGVLRYELIVVLNGCTDSTLAVVQKAQKKHSNIIIIDLKEAGKGHAIITGFKDALNQDSDLIGFVDADMATSPEYFYNLVKQMGDADGIIASRYMQNSVMYPARPFSKKWSRVLVYEPLVRLLFGIYYVDFQCGAKLFRRHVVKKIAPQLTAHQWAFDVELLFLCKKYGFKIKEVPTTWYDQDGSKFTIKAWLPMLRALFAIRWVHAGKKNNS